MPITPTIDNLVDLKIAHLNMLQSTVARMSGFSASAKTFCVTILAAIIALSVQAGTAKLALGAIVAVFCLGLLDLYYLTLELRFRAEYERVAQRPLSDAADLGIKPPKVTRENLAKAARSLSILLFYIPILLACILAFVYTSADERQPIEQLSGRHIESAVGEQRASPTGAKIDEPSSRDCGTFATKHIDACQQSATPTEACVGRIVRTGESAGSYPANAAHN